MSIAVSPPLSLDKKWLSPPDACVYESLLKTLSLRQRKLFDEICALLSRLKQKKKEIEEKDKVIEEEEASIPTDVLVQLFVYNIILSSQPSSCSSSLLSSSTSTNNSNNVSSLVKKEMCIDKATPSIASFLPSHSLHPIHIFTSSPCPLSSLPSSCASSQLQNVSLSSSSASSSSPSSTSSSSFCKPSLASIATEINRLKQQRNEQSSSASSSSVCLKPAPFSSCPLVSALTSSSSTLSSSSFFSSSPSPLSQTSSPSQPTTQTPTKTLVSAKLTTKTSPPTTPTTSTPITATTTFSTPHILTPSTTITTPTTRKSTTPPPPPTTTTTPTVTKDVKNPKLMSECPSPIDFSSENNSNHNKKTTPPNKRGAATPPTSTIVREKRVRSAPKVIDPFLTNDEIKAIHEAKRKSEKEAAIKSIEISKLPLAPILRPTEEEFLDPMKYISSIRPYVQKFGICRIVRPPSLPKPSFPVKNPETFRFPTRTQAIDKLTKACGFVNGGEYSLSEFEKGANKFREILLSRQENLAKTLKEKKNVSTSQLETLFWGVVETGSPELSVNYGNDLARDVNVSPSFSSTTTTTTTTTTTIRHDTDDCWNLNGFSTQKRSVLESLGMQVSGVTSPWLYIGMLCAAFCWHNEDDYLYSLNYLHSGAPKVWYGVPGGKADQFERVMKASFPALFEAEPDLLFQLVTMISPVQLVVKEVPVYRVVQEPGDYVVTFPRAYHAGFNCGFNVAEAVNFALEDWFPFGREASKLYRSFGRASAISVKRLLLACAVNSIAHYHSALILQELAELVQGETALRLNVASVGVARTQRLEKGGDLSWIEAESEDSVQCAVCSVDCFLGYVQCMHCTQESANQDGSKRLDRERFHRDTPREVQAGRPLCLEHLAFLCECKVAESIVYFYRFSLEELSQICRRVKHYQPP